jgi:bifunctional non-homologous end joining protein LigD
MTDTVTIGDHDLDLKHLDKVFFPEANLTKGDVVEYYQRIAPIMLPHLKDRPLNLFRAPDGLKGDPFFQQQISDYFPDWISRKAIEQVQSGTTTHVVCNRPETLVYLANQGCITPHPWLSRQSALNCPDRMIFDLDPPDGKFAPVREAARLLQDLLASIGLTPFVQTTGSRGLHVIAPLDATADYETVRHLAQTLADKLADEYSDSLTTAQYKNQRQGRLYLDTKRNAYGQTAVAPYALRLKPGAPVATPLDWDELGDSELHSQKYTLQTIFRRLGQKADPWEKIDSYAASAKDALQRVKDDSA